MRPDKAAPTSTHCLMSLPSHPTGAHLYCARHAWPLALPAAMVDRACTRPPPVGSIRPSHSNLPNHIPLFKAPASCPVSHHHLLCFPFLQQLTSPAIFPCALDPRSPRISALLVHHPASPPVHRSHRSSCRAAAKSSPSGELGHRHPLELLSLVQRDPNLTTVVQERPRAIAGLHTAALHRNALVRR
jgi:hypothetical protein